MTSAILLLGACEPVADSTLEVAPASEATANEPAPAAPVTPGAPPSGSEEQERQAAACDEETEAAIDRSVGGQLQAFRNGDFDGARAFASSAFREQIDVSEFRSLIENDFAVLLSSTDHTIGHCVTQGDRANALVGVESDGEDVVVLAYRLVREDGEWRVAGAANISRERPTPPPIEA